MEVAIFTFNDFQENSYILHDETKECLIIDPGCNNDIERIMLDSFIAEAGLKPVGLINTHCHIDHVFGNAHISNKYELPLQAHRGEQVVLDFVPQLADMYQQRYEPSPPIEIFLEEGNNLKFGNQELEILLTPGHSPASLSFYNKDKNILIAGDVLFKGSIGRTDLPGGDYDTLINVVRTKLFTLPVDVIVYSGHGESTTIGEEKRTNPFFN